MDLRLADSVAVVTGASRGLGAAIARALAAEGATVIAVARTADALDALVAEAPGRMHALVCDMRDPAALAEVVPRVVAEHGRIDALINNAGIAPAGKFVDQDVQTWRDALEVNVVAPMMLAQAAGRQMIAQNGGRIVNIASTTGLRGKPYLVPYSTSKGALVTFTQALAAEWARYGVQVNCVAPGAFRTDAQQAVTSSPDLLARRIAKIPAGRIAEPDELVPVVCLLASPLAGFTTGAVFVVDGGEVSKL